MLRIKFYLFLNSSRDDGRRSALFTYIWEQYSHRISCYISQILPRSHPDFEDMFQEVMFKIYINLHRFSPAHSFKAWIYRISRNQCLDFLKSRSRNPMTSPAELSNNETSETGTPETAFEKNEMHFRIHNLIHSLEGLNREIAFLRFFEDMNYKNIAEVTGLNENAARVRIHSIKKKVRDSLRRDFETKI